MEGINLHSNYMNMPKEDKVKCTYNNFVINWDDKTPPQKVTYSTHYACNYDVSQIVNNFVILSDMHKNVPIITTTIPTHQEYICIKFNTFVG
jgi:hypothetical protein